MQRELELPDVGEGIAEGEIVDWLIEPGDRVTEDQPVAEVETDKAIVEVPSPIDGTVAELHASAGETVAVGSVIVTFDVEDGADATESTDREDTGTEANADRTESEAASSADGERTSAITAIDRETTDQTTSERAITEQAAGDRSVPASRVVAPPRVKRLARELGVDIGALDGAADGDRITAAEVERFAERSTDPEPHDAGSTADDESSDDPQPATRRRSAAEGQGETVDREKTLAVPATRQLARELGIDIDAVPASEEREGAPFVTRPDVRAYAERTGETAERAESAGPAAVGSGRDGQSEGAAAGGEERIPYRGVRRTIGEQMEEAKYSAPHVSHHDEVDVTELQAVREDLDEEVGEELSLTYMPFVVKAVVRALQDHPEINASLDAEREEIVRKHYYNVGVATATEAGLMVPVVRDVDQKGLVELAEEIETVVERARNREIDLEEMQDGTFTVTNFGAIGGDHATPIINYPEAAILGLGAIRERPQVVDSEVVPRTTLPLSLSVDHRLVDGAIAASFTNDVKRYLHNPALLML